MRQAHDYEVHADDEQDAKAQGSLAGTAKPGDDEVDQPYFQDDGCDQRAHLHNGRRS